MQQIVLKSHMSKQMYSSEFAKVFTGFPCEGFQISFQHENNIGGYLL